MDEELECISSLLRLHCGLATSGFLCPPLLRVQVGLAMSCPGSPKDSEAETCQWQNGRPDPRRGFFRCLGFPSGSLGPGTVILLTVVFPCNKGRVAFYFQPQCEELGNNWSVKLRTRGAHSPIRASEVPLLLCALTVTRTHAKPILCSR